MTAAVISIVTAVVFPVAAQNRRAQGRPVVDLPRGAVRQVILDSCTACHGIDDYAFYAMDRAGWTKMVDSMKAKGATISDDKEAILLDWLSTKFGPDTKPFPRSTTAGPALANFVGDQAAKDGLARQLVQAVCSACHTLERIQTSRFTQEKWRDVVTDMKTKGAQVEDADIAPLADYLVRTYNPAN
jgi:mono/diheme cytochrome c family protein